MWIFSEALEDEAWAKTFFAVLYLMDKLNSLLKRFSLAVWIWLKFSFVITNKSTSFIFHLYLIYRAYLGQNLSLFFVRPSYSKFLTQLSSNFVFFFLKRLSVSSTNLHLIFFCSHFCLAFLFSSTFFYTVTIKLFSLFLLSGLPSKLIALHWWITKTTFLLLKIKQLSFY